MNITQGSFVAGLGALLIAVTASAKQHFVTVDVPNALGTGCYSDCSVNINNWGEMIGSYLDANDVFHGFVRSVDGKLSTFEAPGADTTLASYNGTFPNAINDAGVITGYYVDATGESHGFLRSPEGVFTTIDVPFAGYSNTTPIALNLEGAVVGYTVDQKGSFRGFLRTARGQYKTWIAPGGCDVSPLPTGTGCFGTAGFSINLFGTIAGGYEYNNANFVDLGYILKPDGAFTVFSAKGAGSGSGQGTGCPGCSVPLNQLGESAGFFLDGNGATHGFVRSPWGAITAFDVAGESSTYGLGCAADCSMGLNDFGAVTSFYLDTNSVYRGFVRAPDGKITPFDAPGADTTAGDFNGTFPVSINDLGQIAGTYTDANGNSHAFILCP